MEGVVCMKRYAREDDKKIEPLRHYLRRVRRTFGYLARRKPRLLVCYALRVALALFKRAWRWFRPVIPAALTILLLSVWLATVMEPGEGSFFVDALALLVFLAVIFFADALEVAYSLLRHKDIEQFGDTTGSILQQMHAKEDLIYEGREWLVTAMIVFITLIGEFQHVYIPTLQIVRWHVYWHRFPVPDLLWVPVIHFAVHSTTLFSIFFTTLPVLWLAQGPSKKVARRFPQRMIEFGALLWYFGIRSVGWFTRNFGLDFPTDHVSLLWEKIANLHDDSNLRPSDHHYFVASVQRYGYALHDLQLRICVDKDGGCTIEQRILYYVLTRPGNVFERRLNFENSRQLSFKQITAKAFRVDVIGETGTPGRVEQVMDALDLIADKTRAASPEMARIPVICASLDVVSTDRDRDADPMRYEQSTQPEDKETKAGKDKAEKQKPGNPETERKEDGKKDAEKQQAEKKEVDRQEPEKKDAEKQAAEKQDAEKQQAEMSEAANKAADDSKTAQPPLPAANQAPGAPGNTPDSAAGPTGKPAPPPVPPQPPAPPTAVKDPTGSAGAASAPAAAPTASAGAHADDKAKSKVMHYRIDTRGAIPSDEKAFAILAEFQTTWSAGAFDVVENKPDNFYMNVDSPCRRYRLTVYTHKDCLLRPAEVTADAICGSGSHWGERDRMQNSFSPDPEIPLAIHCDLKYPFPGTKYKLLWEWLKDPHKPEEKPNENEEKKELQRGTAPAATPGVADCAHELIPDHKTLQPDFHLDQRG
jgi:hypothetical protein